MKIDFMKNGMEIYFTNYHVFIPYQSITAIKDVFVNINYRDYSIWNRRFTGENVEKYCSFNICLNDSKKVEILFKEDIKSFPRLPDYENWSFWKRILFSGLNHEGLSKEANDWLNDKEKDMKESIEKLNVLRNEVIKHFNEWKGEKYENNF